MGTLTCLILPQIEGLMDDVDFKAKVTRVEFEELCADLFERVPGPVQQALQSAEMNLVRGESGVGLGWGGGWEREGLGGGQERAGVLRDESALRRRANSKLFRVPFFLCRMRLSR